MFFAYPPPLLADFRPDYSAEQQRSDWSTAREIRCATILLIQQKMPSQYIPIAIFALLAAAFPAVCFAVLKRFRLHLPATDGIGEPVEREASAENSSEPAHPLSFSIVAMICVILAVAIVFLFPWAIKLSQMGWYGMISAAVFVGILLAGYAWACRTGALSGN